MILPIRTSIRPWRTPYANYALIIANAVIFLLTYWPHYRIVAGTPVVEPLRLWAEQFMLTPARPFLWQFVTYAFLHGGYMHIIGNMFFLYLFGNNVNDKLGHIGYLCFYLAGAVFGAIGHILMSNAPVLGASGAVAAVTGAYLVLFPQTLITVLYWFFYFIGTMEVPALYFIALKMIFIDNVIVRYTPNVAYDAHLAGYAYGAAAILLMLATGLITGSSFDLWTMIKQYNRRRRHRDAVSSGYDPFTGRTTRTIKAKEVKSPAQQQKDQEISRLRTRIGTWIAQRNLAAAAQAYVQLIKLDDSQVPPRQYLLDIANQLASENKHAESAQAYEKFLTHYRSYEYAEQVQLMLGILYARYLNKPEPAIKHLRAAAEKLSDPDQIELCQEELDKLQK